MILESGALEVATMASVSAQDPRDETPEQRDDRNLAELLQELRVAGLGVQVLTFRTWPRGRPGRVRHVKRQGVAHPR